MAKLDSLWFIADPIHQTLDLGGGLIKQLAKTPTFQRLRRISQLGLASYVYPGAVHSRFNHCLGAAHLARRVMDHLEDECFGGQRSLHRDLVECAALLHDVGHGPFSHSFERAIARALDAANGKQTLAPEHEDWTKAIISRLRLDPQLERDIGELIVTKGDSSTAVPTYLRQIISSQLDVDRMDYIARDAHFSGIPTGIDLQYLIKSLRVIEHTPGYQTLGLSTKGVRSYEAFAFARHTLFRTLYRHEKVAIFECMMERCLGELAGNAAQRLGVRLPRFFDRLQAMAHSWTSKDELVAGLVEDYQALTEDDIWVAINEAATRNSEDAVARLAQRLVQRDPVKGHRVRYGMGEALARVLKDNRLDRCADVVPLKSTLYQHEPKGSDRIFVIDDRSRMVKDLTECSPVVDALRDRPEVDYVLIAWDLEHDVLGLASTYLEPTEVPVRRSSPPGSRRSTPPSPPMSN